MSSVFLLRCGHCKKLAPEFQAAAKRLKGIVTLAKVSALSMLKLSDWFSLREVCLLVCLFSEGGLCPVPCRWTVRLTHRSAGGLGSADIPLSKSLGMA